MRPARAAACGGRQHMLYHLIKAASGAGRNDTNIINCAGHRRRGHTEAVAAASLLSLTHTRIMQMKAVKLYGGLG